MKLVEPFKDMNEAVTELDNGGYFYNFFTSAKDGKITRSEISKAMHEFDDFDMVESKKFASYYGHTVVIGNLKREW